MLTSGILFLLFLHEASSATLPSRRCTNSTYPISEHVVPLYPPLYSATGVFSADITVGSQTLRAGLDTGSSDTYFLSEDTNCTDLFTHKPVFEAQCGYSGPRYILDKTFEKTPMNFNGSFGNGQATYGPLGYSELVFGGVPVPKQLISPLSYASLGNNPQGNISGLIGLSYPNNTNAYPGTDPLKDIMCKTDPSSPTCGPKPYNPLITTIFNNKLTKPVFAMALSRSAISGGFMTLGGIPRLDDPYINATDGVVATTPIQPAPNTTVRALYLAEVEGLQFNNASAGAGHGTYIVDTGTGISVFPPAQAEAVNALFDPPAIKNATTGQYQVYCNATAPAIGIKLGGQTFYHNPKDLILPYPLAPANTEVCLSAIQNTLAAVQVNLLGTPFLKNVLTVFDVGKSEMTFLSRPYYVDS